MKTLRISDSVHNKLTRLLGETIAKSGKPQTYNNVVYLLTARSVIISTKLLEKIDALINAKQFGYKSREQIVEDAVAAMIQHLSENVNEKNSSRKA